MAHTLGAPGGGTPHVNILSIKFCELLAHAVSYLAHASTHSRHKKAGANPGKIVCSLQLAVLITSLVQGHDFDGKHGGRLIGVNEALSLD